MPNQKSKRATQLEFKLGDIVIHTFAGREHRAVIVEDIGPIGVGGRRLVRVQWQTDTPDEPIEFVLAVDDLRRAG